MKSRKVKIPKWARNLFKPFRYKVGYGGRGSAKSHSFARALLLIGAMKETRILCAREFQNSIKDSSHKLLSDLIEKMGLQHHYTITNNGIYGANGTEFIFKGVHHNVDSIKSMEGIDILWLEEAHTVSQVSWDILIPTIRKAGSEIWVTFNPDADDDPTYTMFVDKAGQPIPRPNAFIMKINWKDNPWFPEELKNEKDFLREKNYEKYLHVWEGECRSHSDAQIFKGKFEVRDFQIREEWDGPYFGADWGFSVDPASLIKLYIDVAGRTIYVAEEFYEVGVDIDILPQKYDTVTESRTRVIRADNARPETISYMCKNRFNVIACDKWPGSVEDGIEWLKTWKIVISPRCPHTAVEFKKYSYKVDRLTQDVTTDIVDAHNHAIDAIRYAFEPMITASRTGILSVL